MRNYYRQFVTLLQERPGYAMPGKQAVGRIVIEAREEAARATVYIQDLSPQNTYKLAFINKAAEVNLGVVMGTIIVDERGRYEGKFEFNRTDIGGSRITCERIDACVVFLAGSEEEFAAPLVGYRMAPFSWRVNLSFPDGKDDSPILEVKQAAEPEEPVAEVEEPIGDEADEIEEEEGEGVLGIAENTLETEEVPPPVYDFAVEEPVYLPKESPAQMDENPEPVKNDEADRISDLFQNESAVEIFSKSDRFPNAQWIVTTAKRVGEIGKIQAMGLNGGDEILSNPLVKECCDKHRHILLGRDTDDGHDIYILGIPDIFDITVHTNEHEFNSIFDSFKLCNPSDPVKGAHGYWLKQL